MDLVRRIEIFARAADAGSFAKVASSLDVTPSAISRAIASLEKELRVPLFYRTTRLLKLTEDGEEVYRRGRDILDRLAALETAMSGAPARVTGTLRVGLSVSLSRYLVIPGLATFMRRHPALRLDFSVVSHPREMHAEGVDLLLRVTDPPESTLIARKLAQLRFGVYAAPEYLAEAGTPEEPEDLLRHRCFAHRPAAIGKAQDEWVFERRAERRTVKVEPAFATDDREALIAAVVGGAGVMRIGMFDPTLVTSGRPSRLLPSWSCPGGQSVYALYRRTPRLPGRIAAFLAFVEEALAAFDADEITIRHRPRTQLPPRHADRAGRTRVRRAGD